MKRAGKIVLLISAITGFCICTHASGRALSGLDFQKDLEWNGYSR